MLTVVVVACVVVLLAMMLDLASGLYKAKLRGEIRSSWGLKRTLSKFIAYEGGMLIAAGVDLLMHLSKLVDLFGLTLSTAFPSSPVSSACSCSLSSLLASAKRPTKRRRRNSPTLPTCSPSC